MAVTRINNNQITDSSAGNVYLGINAGTKLQDYSITAGKIANSLVYGSDFTITGNLTVNGQTTTIDTVSTVIEDPVIVLASNQTGTPAVDIGFIGERGDQNNIAFVWDESADEFVTAFTTDLVTNTTITISSYANFHTNDANIGGNITINGTTTLVGNIASDLNVTGNIKGGNLLTEGVVTATGNITGGNLSAGSGTIVTTGNINGANVNATAGITAGTTVIATGNVSGGNLNTAGQVVATGNVNGGNLVTAGLTDTGTLAVSSTSTFTGNITSALNVTGNIAGGNISTPGLISAVGNVSGGNLNTSGLTSTGTLAVSSTSSFTGNITSAFNVTGNIAGGNISTSGLITAVGNVSGGNLTTSGLTSTGTLETTGNALIGGNLVVQGNITYINIDDLRVEDPIIILGTGPNGAPLTTDDGLDRGIFMEYYTTGLGNAFMGWDNSSGNIVIAADAYFTANDVVGINSYGTLEAGNLYIQSAVSTGNITGGNLNTGGQVVATGNVTGGNIVTAGVTDTGTLTVSSTSSFTGNITSAFNVTGNITGGNLSAGAGIISTTGNVNGGNVNVTGNVNSVDGYFTGNVGVLGTLTATSNIIANTSGIFYGDTVTGNAAIYAGLPTFTILGSNVVAQFTGNVNSYSQINFENISNGNRASTDYIATADNGDDSSYYVDLGINSSTFDDPVNYAGYGPNDSYVHNHGGNLIINPETTGTTIKLMVGGTANSDVISTVSEQGLYVDVGNLYTPNITSLSGRVTVNSGSDDVDFAVNGDTSANVFYVDAATGTASFGSSTQTTNAIVAFNATNSILMPVGNTTQRPGTGVIGMLRFNSVDDNLEIYSSSGWEAVGVPVFTVIADEQFNGDGSTLAFTLGSSQTTASCIVSINGVVQIPTIAYSVSGTTLTFTEAPEPGDLIDVRQLTTTTTVTAISNTGGNAIVQPNSTAANVDITGNLIPSSNIAFNLGSSTARWNELFLAGNTLTLGSIVMKDTGGQIGFFESDGTTPATIDSASVDTTTIANGTSSMSVIASGGNIRANVGGATIINITSSGITNGQGNGVGNIGSSSGYFNTIFAQATSAQYADLAEKYTADAEYAPGTVVVFGGDKEVTVTSTDADRAVAGVISTNPSYIMNGGLEAEYVATVALTGRVPCRVTGAVRKGDLMVSAGYGLARAEADPKVGTVIGKALENFEGTEGVIEVVVGRF